MMLRALVKAPLRRETSNPHDRRRRGALFALAVLALVAPPASAGPQREAGAKAGGLVSITYTSWEEGWDGPIEGQDEILPEIIRRTGVNITLHRWIVTSEDERRRQLVLWTSTGDMPEWLLIPTDGYTVDLMNQAGDDGRLWTIDGFTARWKLPADVMRLAIANNTYYASPESGKQYILGGPTWDPKWTMEKENAQEGMLIRKDWLDRAGLGYPQTPDGYAAALTAFAGFGNVNGQPVVPLVLSENLGGSEYIRRWFFDVSDRVDEGYNLFRRMPDGTYTNAPIMERLEPFVLFMNRLYREGLLDPEAGTIKDSQYQEKMTSGRAGSTGTAWWNMNSYNDAIRQLDPGALLVYMPMPKGPGVQQPVQQWVGVGAPSAWVFSRKTDQSRVEAAFRVVEYLSGAEGMKLGLYGIEGRHWQLDKDGRIAYTQAFMDETRGDWNAGAHLGVGYYSMGINQSILNDLRAVPPADLRPDIIESRRNLTGTIFMAFDPQDLVPPGPVQTAKLAMINKAWRKRFISAVLAGSENECRALVEGWPAQWAKLGGNDIVAEKNALMQNAKK